MYHTISEYQNDKVQGIFCGSLAQRLGLQKNFQKACHDLGGKSNDNGWCKIDLNIYDTIDRKSLFCVGIPERSAVSIRILLQEHTAPNSEPIYNYEWVIAGVEFCDIWKIMHKADEGISLVVGKESKGYSDDDPSTLKSTKFLQGLYIRSWSMIMKQQSNTPSGCLVYPGDDKKNDR